MVPPENAPKSCAPLSATDNHETPLLIKNTSVFICEGTSQLFVFLPQAYNTYIPDMGWYEIAIVVLIILAVLVALLVTYSAYAGQSMRHILGGGGEEEEDDGEYGFRDIWSADEYGDSEFGCDDSDCEDGIDGGGQFRLQIRDPWYTKMLHGEKLVEARRDKKPFNTLEVGDEITVVRSRPRGDTSEYKDGPYKYTTTITRITKFTDIAALLKKEGVQKVFPGTKTKATAITAFAEFAGDDGVNLPVLAIEVAPK